MNPESKDRNIFIEQHKPFSKSALWRMQREYFDQAGIDAWVNQVPFYITSNPFIARCYAKLVLAFIRDWIKKNPDAKNHPFYLMELGTGSGRFSYYFVKTLHALLQENRMSEVHVTYIMSDFTKNNIQYYEKHPALKPYIEKGLIDFAIYDLESSRSIALQRNHKRLDATTLVNPLTIFANYIFDTVSHDAFTVRKNTLYELLFTLSTPESNMKNHRPVEMEKIKIDYNVKEIEENYYGDKVLDSILTKYKNSLSDTNFLFPIGSIHAIQFLKKLANDKLFIISTDKGYSTLDSLDRLSHPTVSFHGSFSMMVNFHAIAEYCKNTGGDAFLQSRRKGIKTSLFTTGFTFEDMQETHIAIQEYVEGFSPADYFMLHRRMSDAFQECALDTLASHLQLSLWDPHIYMKLSNRIITLIPEADRDTLKYLSYNMKKIAANYYYMPKSECVLFEIAIFFHATHHYDEALKYYRNAEPFVSNQHGLYYNMALCHHHLGDNQSALTSFRKALEIDANSKEASEWIAHIEANR